MSKFYPAMYFDVELGLDMLGISGQFTKVTGLSKELNYETYVEGGSATPHYFFRQLEPQTLVLERGILTSIDQFSLWMTALEYGAMIRLCGMITLKNAQGKKVQSWIIPDAYPMRYFGPELDSQQSAIAVNRIELAYNGCS